MSTFDIQVGDKIRCVDTGGYALLTLGGIYEVGTVKVTTSGIMLGVLGTTWPDETEPRDFFAFRFEVVRDWYEYV